MDLAAAPAIEAPQPLPNEQREQYIVRAHRELMQAVPDPDERNRIVWGVCDQTFGDPDRERASRLFTKDKYETHPDVCLWHEHEAVSQDREGNPIVRNNDVDRLTAIVQENNLRIADTDAYTALVDKHTVAPGQRDPMPPKTLGFIGPYRLGMIGRVNPRFAIFGDEHHRKDAAETLRDRPRRSVEVLTLKANGRSYLDPIAALSEAPRLPLPVRYSAEANGEEYTVDRYSAEPTVAASPGGSNTFIPGGVGKKRQSYEATAPQPPEKSMLAPEDLRQIIDALMETPQMQFVGEMMGQGGQNVPGQEPAPPSIGDEDSAPMPEQGPPPPAPAPPPLQPPQGAKPPAPYAAPYAGGMAQRYGVDDDAYELEDDTDMESEKYAALSESHGRLMEDRARDQERIAMLEQRAADAERSAQLQHLANKYAHFVDLDEEFGRCLYSAGSDMDDTQFDEHVEMIESYAARVPAVTPMVPGGDSGVERPGGRVESERYEAKVANRAVEIYTAEMEQGNVLTYEAATAKAREEIQA